MDSIRTLNLEFVSTRFQVIHFFIIFLIVDPGGNPAEVLRHVLQLVPLVEGAR
jgi:hypothetical protein